MDVMTIRQNLKTFGGSGMTAAMLAIYQQKDIGRIGLQLDGYGVHRTLEYCVAQCESLAQQLAGVKP